MERGHLVPGDTLGKYRLERLVGRGGMGEVWAAHDPDLDRRIALKVLRPQLGANDDARLRLQREGRAMARLRHPNVITVYDATFTEDRGIIAMELVDGESLAAWMTRHHTRSEILRVLLAAGRGLAAAHAANMVHLDFKPHNVLVDRDGRVLVTDFGLARESTLRAAAPRVTGPAEVSGLEETAASSPREVSGLEATAASSPREISGLEATASSDPVLDATATPVTVASTAPRRAPALRGELDTPLTETGALLGTPAYMAPEQLVGVMADAKADQFAFCVTVWEALAGERPFRGKSLEDLVVAVGGDPGTHPKVPRRLRGLLARGLARDPAARWPSMAALLDALERAWRRPRVLAVAIGGGLALAAIATVVVVLSTRSSARLAEGCDPAVIDGLWSPQVRADLVKKIIDPEAAAIVPESFDRWARDWKAEQARVCADPDASGHDAQLGCLNALRAEVEPLIERRAEIPGDAYADPWLRRLLTPPAQCRTHPRSVPLPSTDPAVRREVGVLRGELLAARRALLGGTPLALLVDVKPQVERAKQLAYAPLEVEAELLELVTTLVHDRSASHELCGKFRVNAGRARAAAYPRLEIEAQLLAYGCSMLANYEPLAAEALRDLADLVEVATPRQRVDVLLLLARDAVDAGRNEAALALVEKVRAIRENLGLGTSSQIDLNEAMIRMVRGRGDDLARGLALVEANRAAAEQDPTVGSLAAELPWRLERPRPVTPRQKKPKDDDVVVELLVVDERGPVPGAVVGASPRATVDATSPAMEEVGDPTIAVANAKGRVTLRLAPTAVIVARHGDRIGAIAIREGGGAHTVAIGPGGSVTGRVANVDPDPGDPTDLVTRARRRSRAIAHLARAVGNRVLVFSAPVRADGTWSLPVVMPGAYTYAAQAEVALHGVHGVQVMMNVRVGANRAPDLAFDPDPRVIEIEVRPVDGGAVALPGGEPAPKTWTELYARLASSPYVSVGELRPVRLEDAAKGPDDKVARLPVTDEPTTVCVFTGVIYERSRPISRLGRGGKTEPPPPRCIVVSPSGPVTHVFMP